MASAGVVGMAEVITPNSTVSSQRLVGSVAMWSFVWVGVSIFFLFFIHLAVVGRGRR
jgi:hypothetical protein